MVRAQGRARARRLGDLRLHYSDADAPPSPEDPNEVFALNDDFPGAPLAARWLTLGSPTPSGGLVLGPGGQRDDHGRSAGDAAGTYFCVGFQHESDFGTGAPFLNWVGRPAVVHRWTNVPAETDRCADVPSDDAAHVFRIERGADTTTYVRDGEVACASMVTDPTDYSIQLHNQSPIATVTVDWVRVRPLIEPELEVTVGPEDRLAL